MVLTPVTPAEINQRSSRPVDVCAQIAHTNWRKCGGADEVGRFIVTETGDAAGIPSQFYCRICQKDVSVLTHGVHEVLKHYQGVRPFPHWLATETGDTMLAGTRFWGKAVHWERAKTSKGVHSSGSFGVSGLRVPFCRGSDCWRVWDPGCYSASPCNGVITGGSSAIVWPLRVGSPPVGPFLLACQPGQNWCDIVPRWGARWYFPCSVFLGIRVHCFIGNVF